LPFKSSIICYKYLIACGDWVIVMARHGIYNTKNTGGWDFYKIVGRIPTNSSKIEDF